MQMYPSCGIVLRNDSSKNKITIFDQQQGKIYGLSKRHDRCPHGGLIYYRSEEWRSHVILHDVDLIALPALWVRYDILFFHHVLELILYFMQPAQQSHELFALCKIMYKYFSYEGKQLLFFKKLFLCRLLITMGIYTELLPTNLENNRGSCDEADANEDQILFSLISGSGDIMLNEYHELLDKKMSIWLNECLQTHAGKTHLKTLDFLVKVETDEIR